MNKKNILFAAVIILVVTSIVLLERMKTEYPTTPLGGEELSTSNTTQQTEADMQRIQQKSAKYMKAVELVEPDGYINADNITIKELIGKKVILVDFWTYSCINCQRTLPYLTDWYNKYKDQGFIIIGVHTPEFEFEKDYDNVVRATKKFGIEYPVVQDNNYYTWRAYRNNYWPRKYLIDIDGFIVYDHIGEGAYQETEEKIQDLLKERMDVLGIEATLPEVQQTKSEEVQNMFESLGITKELYSGYEYALLRGQDIGNIEGLQRDQTVNYTLPDKLRNDIIYAEGSWLSNSDNLQAQGQSSIYLKFYAKSANIVANTFGGPAKAEITLDGEPLTESNAGKDVKLENGKSYITADHADLYNVYNGEYGRHTIKISVDSKDFNFNSFTFG